MATYPKIAIPFEERVLLVQPHEILYAIAKGNSTTITLSNNRTTRVSKKLKEVMSLLSDEMFIRIHHSHFINLEHVVCFNEKGQVQMKDETALSISRSRKSVLMDRFVKI